MNRIFVDALYWVAVINPRDQVARQSRRSRDQRASARFGHNRVGLDRIDEFLWRVGPKFPRQNRAAHASAS